MSKKSLAPEIAEAEFNSWLDHIEASKKKREEGSEFSEAIIEAMCNGNLVLNEDKSFTQTLKFPIGGDTVKALTFKSRLKVSTLRICTQGISNKDSLGLICGTIAALTGTDRNIINEMDMVDYKIGQAIAVFF